MFTSVRERIQAFQQREAEAQQSLISSKPTPLVSSKINSTIHTPITSRSARIQPQPVLGFVRRGANGTPTTPSKHPHTLPDGSNGLGVYGRRQTQAFASPAARRTSHAEEHRTQHIAGPVFSEDIISQPIPPMKNAPCASHRYKCGRPTTPLLERGISGQYEPVRARERTQVEITDPSAFPMGNAGSSSHFQVSCDMCRVEAVVKPLKRKWKSTEDGNSVIQRIRALGPLAVEGRPASEPSMSPKQPTSPAVAPMMMASLEQLSIPVLAMAAQSLKLPTPAVSASTTDSSAPIQATAPPSLSLREQEAPTSPLDTSIPAATAAPAPSLSPWSGRVSDSKYYVQPNTTQPAQDAPTSSSNNPIDPTIPQPNISPSPPETAPPLTELTTAINHLNTILSAHRITLKHLARTLSAELGRLSSSLEAVGAKLQDLPRGPGRSVVEMAPGLRAQVDTFGALMELLDESVEVWRVAEQGAGG